MIIEVLVAVLASYVAVEAIVLCAKWCFLLLSKRRLAEKSKEWLVNHPLTEEDLQLIEKNRQLLKEVFPDDEPVGEQLLRQSNEERVQTILKIVEEACENYQVELDAVRFARSSEIGEYTLGYYCRETNEVMFNLDMVCCDSREVLEEVLDTVFHELRHAQQYRAVMDESFDYGSEEQRRAWALNLAPGNYIPYNVDFELYQRQTVEADARAVGEATVRDL